MAANETIGTLTGSGAVPVNTNTISVGIDNSSTTFPGIISGTTGGLTKVGTGTLTLTGSNTYGGTTLVSSGTLLASSVPTSNLLAYYSFDNAGNLAGQTDSGNGNNGTLNGASDLNQQGRSTALCPCHQRQYVGLFANAELGSVVRRTSSNV